MKVSSPKLDDKFLKGKNQVPNVFNIIHRMHEVVLSREKKSVLFGTVCTWVLRTLVILMNK